jgi:hypothetical protein
MGRLLKNNLEAGEVAAMSCSRWWLLAVGIALAASVGGCHKHDTVPRSASTGAEEIAKTFFDGLRTQNWTAAYDTLDPESRARCSKEQFAVLGQQFLRELEFTPSEVGVLVSESGDHATAIATFRGLSGTTTKQFKDGTSLRRTPEGWVVELRANFGKPSGKGTVPGK